MWMENLSEKPIFEHNYANIKTLLLLHCFLVKFVCSYILLEKLAILKKNVFLINDKIL